LSPIGNFNFQLSLFMPPLEDLARSVRRQERESEKLERKDQLQLKLEKLESEQLPKKSPNCSRRTGRSGTTPQASHFQVISQAKSSALLSVDLHHLTFF
jgi:hypothetical protein